MAEIKMHRSLFRSYRTLLGIGCLLAGTATYAQEAYDGLTLLSPMNSTATSLVELDGTVVQTWHGQARPASMAYRLDDGSILRPCRDPNGAFEGGSVGGRIQRIDSEDVVVWDYFFSTSDFQQHHDIQPLPNGSLLLIAWESKTAQEAIDAGRQNITSAIWPTLIVEIQPVGASGGNVVWEWHAWDHLIQDVDPEKANYGVVADHPELIDINYGSVGNPQSEGDWIHANAIDYNEELDQVVFSSRSFNELYVIDHSTTTEEAAGHTGGNSGHGGDLLYRWGNPQVYDRGGDTDQIFHVVHGVNWIDTGLPGEGNLLAFNNGDRPGQANDYSTVMEITPPIDVDGAYIIEPGEPFGPQSPTWAHGEVGEFYGGPTQCGAFRMPNGNTLICLTEPNDLFEVTELGETVWEYTSPIGAVARAERYGEDSVDVYDPGSSLSAPSLSIWPNPLVMSATISFSLSTDDHVRIRVLDPFGRTVALLVDRDASAGASQVEWDGRDGNTRALAHGIYFAVMEIGGRRIARKLTLVR